MTKAVEEKKPQGLLSWRRCDIVFRQTRNQGLERGLFYVRDRGGVCFLTVAPFKMNGLMKTLCRATVRVHVSISTIAPCRQKKSERRIKY